MSPHIDRQTLGKSLRLWPGVAIVTVQWLLRFVAPALAPDATVFGMPLVMLAVVAGFVGGPAVIVWWLFFSRAPWRERAGATLFLAAALLGSYLVVHPSIATGMMGMMLPIFAMPLFSLALVVSAVAARRLSSGRRSMVVAGSIVAASAALALVRTGGVTGDGASDLHWRWTATAEERLLARTIERPPAAAPRAESASPAGPAAAGAAAPEPRGAVDGADPASADAAPSGVRPEPPRPEGAAAESATGRADAHAPVDPPGVLPGAEWPGFRGPGRDSVVRGVRIETDWAATPPKELWRRAIGPGWSSFAVGGDLIYTQEQRGDDEIVSSYRLSTGEPVWMHRDAVRFWESNAGAGPRATPTLHDGRVYTLGATGLLNALDARTGARVWSRDAAADTGREAPDWGFASSPIVTGDLVIAALAGQLAAYDIRTGEPRWTGTPEGGGYSSPHLLTIDGVSQIVLLRGRRTTSVAPADGAVLWEDFWQPAVSIVQPALAPGGDLLVAAGDAMGGIGIRRIGAARGPSGWAVQKRWTTRGLKPYFNDFVVHEGHAFGFDGSILACINLADGRRVWKGGRFGHGQLLLLPDQDLMLILSEHGELALVKASPEQFAELARVPAIEGKTWNHPVLVGDVVLVRNGEEMAAFRLPIARR